MPNAPLAAASGSFHHHGRLPVRTLASAAMWDRFLPSSSSTTTVTTVAAALPLPDARLSLRSGAGIHKPRLSRLRGAYRHSRSDDAHDPINALGISNGPLRYEIRHGKVVPQAAHRDISLSSRHPAREPLRERTQQASLPRTPASPSQQFVCEASDSDGTQDSDKASPKSLFGLATGDMYRHTAEEQVSPPSSPDLDHAGVGRLVDDVSPIDDELDLARSIGAHDAVRHHASHASATSYHHRKPPAATLPMTSHQPRWSKAARRPLNAQHRPAQLAAAHLDEANGSRRVDGPSYDMSGHGSSSGPMPAPTGRPTRVPPAILGQRRRLVAQNKPEPIDTRPPWKGASGRSKILSPVRDDLNVAPLRLPPKGAQPASLSP
ncbi:hypothetical protein CDD83_9487 [Cordyceps sp. RAO-2017]|nr:hypothetical protein CDD83_9487 [Cordyceps sp. RAO-2017]